MCLQAYRMGVLMRRLDSLRQQPPPDCCAVGGVESSSKASRGGCQQQQQMSQRSVMHAVNAAVFPGVD